MKKIFWTLLFLNWSCQSAQPPVEEYALARSAYEAALAAQAPRHSPGFWNQADSFYRQGQVFYRVGDYGHAQEEFIKAKKMAEKAENSARLIKQKTGDVL